MQYSDKIILRKVTDDGNENGYPNPVTTDRTVWADERSVKRSEYYDAAQAGVKVRCAYAVHLEDYDNENYVVVDGEVYVVERGYKVGLGEIELVCRKEDGK